LEYHLGGSGFKRRRNVIRVARRERKEKMKTKVLLALAMGLAVGLTLYPLEGNAMMGGGGGGMGGGMMGGFGSVFGSGMMGGGSYGMGPGAGQNMGPGSGQGAGPGMNFPGDVRQYSPQTQQPQKRLDKNDARRMAENYLVSIRKTPNLDWGVALFNEMKGP
jgi:hypothetical protein